MTPSKSGHLAGDKTEPKNQAQKHSALPWRADGSEMSLATWVYDANHKRVCTMKQCEKDWGNAALIVEAVNSHATLTERVAKLEAALERVVKADTYRMSVIASSDLGKLNHSDEQFWSAIDNARDVLAGRP